MPEFLIFVRKINKIPEFYTHEALFTINRQWVSELISLDGSSKFFHWHTQSLTRSELE